MRIGRMNLAGWRKACALGFLLAGVMAAWLGSAAADPEEARVAFRRYCAACHGMEGRGDGPNAPSLGETQPRDLTDPGYMGKLSDDHLRKVIAEGGRSVDRSPFMPAFGRTLPGEKLRDLVAYVRGLHTRRERPPRKVEAPEEKGARLVRELGCPNCHTIGDIRPRPIAPPLERAGEKFRRGWLIEFLKIPRRIRPLGHLPLSYSRMPEFRLSQEEAEALAAYLLARRKEEDGQRISGASAAKEAAEGFQLLLRHGCRACHAFEETGGVAGPDLTHVKGRLRNEWMARFIENPQSWDPATPMPNLGVSSVEARALARFFSPEEVGRQDAHPLPPNQVSRGKALFEGLGCASCHEAVAAAKRPEGPPDLTHLGDKVQAEWLRQFLKKPRPMRFWLKARMPDFRLSEEEADALARYFMRHRRDPEVKPIPPAEAPDPSRAEAGRALFVLYECAKCHPAPGAPLRPGEDAALAPSLEDAGLRLNPDWVLRFLRNPQSIYPGTKMPSFFYDAGEPIEKDAEEKMRSIRDYLMTLKR